ncbi:hypothetical protein F5Y16DRAFT_412782 [Xylariaceae sp. FL0255]|nr:hypothetical protein F5Y16DRAFT_412782 [Xylariaceae sp. FL0255]
MEPIDVAIIGGGPAGLAAAATLARHATSMQMIPGWENKDPQGFRSATKADITSNYVTIQFSDVEVTQIEKQSDSHFNIRDASEKEWNKCPFLKQLLTVFSNFHYLFCHGYEERGASSTGVLEISPLVIPAFVMQMAQNAAQLSESVTVYTSGNEDLASYISATTQNLNSKFRIESRQISRVAAAGTGTLVVELVNGEKKEEKFLAYHTATTVQGPFVAQLGIALTPTGDIQADASAFHQTSVRGVFAAGDCITPYKVIPGATSSGCNATVAVSTQLQAEKYGQNPMF